MKNKELHNKNIKELNIELFNLLREQFNLKMQSVSKQSKKPHLFKKSRRNIARIKTLLTERINA